MGTIGRTAQKNFRIKSSNLGDIFKMFFVDYSDIQLL